MALEYNRQNIRRPRRVSQTRFLTGAPGQLIAPPDCAEPKPNQEPEKAERGDDSKGVL